MSSDILNPDRPATDQGSEAIFCKSNILSIDVCGSHSPEDEESDSKRSRMSIEAGPAYLESEEYEIVIVDRFSLVTITKFCWTKILAIRKHVKRRCEE
jgi:hypothetical protein